MKIFTSLLIALFCIFCQNPNPDTASISPSTSTPNDDLATLFETELNQLNPNEISALDLATSLFKKYVQKTQDLEERDKFFIPYFNFYNNGSKLRLNQGQDIIHQYGFRKVTNEEKSYLVPTESSYLKDNIIQHLSKPMQTFCVQQLKEFESPKDLETIAKRTLWWGNFNQENPNFLLKEMADYHYNNWHLKQLLSGTKNIAVFEKNDKLASEALTLYQKLLKQNPNSNTAKTIATYLDLLKENNWSKTKEIENYLEKFN